MQKILAVNFDTDSFQRAVLRELGNHFDVKLWPYYGFKKDRVALSDSLTPLTRIHLEAVRHIPEGPNLRSPIWPDGFRPEDSRAVELCCDRVFPAPLSRGDQTIYLSRLSEGVEKELEGIDPICVLFPATPHVPWDLVAALKLADRGIPVFAIRATQITNRVIVSRLPFEFVSGSFEQRPDNLDIPTIDLEEIYGDSPRLKVAKSLNRDSSPSPKHFILVQPMRLVRSVLVSTWRVFWDQVNRNLSRSDRKPGDARAQRDEHYWNFLTGRDFLRLRVKSLSHMYSMMREMSRASSGVEGEYVYFSLHYQPEQNTDPESSIYRFQSGAVAELRKVLDEQGLKNLRIVVKDHPRQFGGAGDVRSRNFRVRGFYETIASMENTSVVGPNVASSSLIDGAQLVVTANGSAAWEAVRAGKPSLTLVSTWHSDCRASPSLARLQESGRSISDLIAMSPEDVKASMAAFLETERITIPGAFKGQHADLTRNPDLVKDLVKSLVPIIQSRSDQL